MTVGEEMRYTGGIRNPVQFDLSPCGSWDLSVELQLGILLSREWNEDLVPPLQLFQKPTQAGVHARHFWFASELRLPRLRVFHLGAMEYPLISTAVMD